MTGIDSEYNHLVFAEQMQVACAREKTPATPYQAVQKCGYFGGLLDAIKIVWRSLWQPKEVGIEHVARAMLSSKEVSPSAVRWFSDRTIEKIFLGVSQHDTTLEKAAMWAVVDARSERTRRAIASIFRKTFAHDATLIQRIPTPSEHAQITSLLSQAKEAARQGNHPVLLKSLTALEQFARARTFMDDEERDLQVLEHQRPSVVLDELVHETAIPPGVDTLLANYAGYISPEFQREIEQDVRSTHGIIDDFIASKLFSNGNPMGENFTSLALNNTAFTAGHGPYSHTEKMKMNLLATTFPNLTRLSLVSCDLIGSHIRAIGEELKLLEELDISGNFNIMFQGLKLATQPFAELRVLKMNNAGFRDEDLTHMPRMPALESLSIRGGLPYDTQFTAPLQLLKAKCPNLTHLDLGGSSTLRLAQLEGLEGLPKLKQLTITHCPNISASEIEQLRVKFPHLTILA